MSVELCIVIRRTIWLTWRLRAAYSLGADPARLAQQYGHAPG